MVLQAPVQVHTPAMRMPLLPGAAAAAAVRCCAGLVCSITITTVVCPLLPAPCCCLPDLVNGLCITGPEAVHNLDVNTVIIHLTAHGDSTHASCACCCATVHMSNATGKIKATGNANGTQDPSASKQAPNILLHTTSDPLSNTSVEGHVYKTCFCKRTWCNCQEHTWCTSRTGPCTWLTLSGATGNAATVSDIMAVDSSALSATGCSSADTTLTS